MANYIVGREGFESYDQAAEYARKQGYGTDAIQDNTPRQDVYDRENKTFVARNISEHEASDISRGSPSYIRMPTGQYNEQTARGLSYTPDIRGGKPITTEIDTATGTQIPISGQSQEQIEQQRAAVGRTAQASSVPPSRTYAEQQNFLKNVDLALQQRKISPSSAESLKQNYFNPNAREIGFTDEGGTYNIPLSASFSRGFSPGLAQPTGKETAADIIYQSRRQQINTGTLSPDSVINVGNKSYFAGDLEPTSFGDANIFAGNLARQSTYKRESDQYEKNLTQYRKEKAAYEERKSFFDFASYEPPIPTIDKDSGNIPDFLYREAFDIEREQREAGERGFKARESLGLGFLNPKPEDSWIKSFGRGVGNLGLYYTTFGTPVGLGTAELAENVYLAQRKAKIIPALALYRPKQVAEESKQTGKQVATTTLNPTTPEGATTYLTAGVRGYFGGKAAYKARQPTKFAMDYTEINVANELYFKGIARGELRGKPITGTSLIDKKGIGEAKFQYRGGTIEQIYGADATTTTLKYKGIPYRRTTTPRGEPIPTNKIQTNTQQMLSEVQPEITQGALIEGEGISPLGEITNPNIAYSKQVTKTELTGERAKVDSGLLSKTTTKETLDFTQRDVFDVTTKATDKFVKVNKELYEQSFTAQNPFKAPELAQGSTISKEIRPTRLKSLKLKNEPLFIDDAGIIPLDTLKSYQSSRTGYTKKLQSSGIRNIQPDFTFNPLDDIPPDISLVSRQGGMETSGVIKESRFKTRYKKDVSSPYQEGYGTYTFEKITEPIDIGGKIGESFERFGFVTRKMLGSTRAEMDFSLFRQEGILERATQPSKVAIKAKGTRPKPKIDTNLGDALYSLTRTPTRVFASRVPASRTEPRSQVEKRERLEMELSPKNIFESVVSIPPISTTFQVSNYRQQPTDINIPITIPDTGIKQSNIQTPRQEQKPILMQEPFLQEFPLNPPPSVPRIPKIQPPTDIPFPRTPPPFIPFPRPRPEEESGLGIFGKSKRRSGYTPSLVAEEFGIIAKGSLKQLSKQTFNPLSIRGLPKEIFRQPKKTSNTFRKKRK